MILLNPENYYKLQQPLKSVEINHLFALAVVEQKIDGEIYVDDVKRPSTFYVKHNYGMALLFGNTDNEQFNRQLVSYLLNENCDRKAIGWLQAYPKQWNDKLEELFAERLINNSETEVNNSPGKYVVKSTRVNFRFNPVKYFTLKPNIRSEFSMLRTNAELFDRINGTVVPRFFWRSGEQFVQKGAGISLMLENEPVSTAFSAFVQDNQLELGIETYAQFHGKGLAQLTCSALIDYCLENNFEPVWACRLENTGSYKLAQKLGFEPVRMIPYYQLP